MFSVANDEIILLRDVDRALKTERRTTQKYLDQHGVAVRLLSPRKRGVLAADLQRMLDNLKSVKQGVE